MSVYFRSGLVAILLGLVTLGCKTVKSSGLVDSEGASVSQSADALFFMGEEEKLARDVYLKNAERYGLQIFSNIADAEQRHMDAVISLINEGDLENPAEGLEVGEFLNKDLAALYTALDARSQVSVVEALKVGAEIEEIDILDLIRLSEGADSKTQQTFDNLLRGSRNHLRAYVRQLDNRGIDYQPQHLVAEQFANIIDSPQERGNKRGGGHRQGRGHRQVN